MAEIDTTDNNNFGIEETMSVDTAGAGDQSLLKNLMDTGSAGSDPDDVTSIDDGSDDDGGVNPSTTTTKKGKDGKSNPTSLAGEEDDVPANKATNPEALTNFLLGNDDEEEEEEDIDEKEDDEDGTPASKKRTEANVSGGTDDEEEEEEERDDDDDSDAGNSDSIAFDSLANELADLGVFNRLEGEEDEIAIKSPEDFLERFKKEKQMGAQQMVSDFISQFGEDYQEAFNAIYVNGTDPKEYFSQSAKIEQFSNMDLSKESNQEKVVRQSLADQEFEQEDIDAEIEKLKDYGDLEDASKRHHKVLVKKEKQTLKQKEAEANQKQQAKQLQKQTYIDNVNQVLSEKLKQKEFDGIPLNAKTANELQDFLLVDKWKTESGETLTDFDRQILDLKRPENHETKVKVGLLLKLLEKDPTLSTIQKRGVSKESKQLFKDVARQKTTSKRTGMTKNKKSEPKSWFQ